MGNFGILANRIKELRKKDNMTQVEFSKKIGCTSTTLSAYENNLKKPSLDIIMDIAEKCNVSIDWLCGLSDEKSKKTKIMTYTDIIEICNTYKNPPVWLEKTIDGMRKNLCEYIEESQHMRKLIGQGIIDMELYNLWVEKTMKKYDKPIVEEKPEVVDPFKDIEFENFDED